MIDPPCSCLLPRKEDRQQHVAFPVIRQTQTRAIRAVTKNVRMSEKEDVYDNNVIHASRVIYIKTFKVDWYCRDYAARLSSAFSTY